MQTHPFLLTTLNLRGKAIRILVVPDHDPLMRHAHQLWRTVYVSELGYGMQGVTPSWETDQPKGGLVMLAMDGDACVATLRMLYGSRSALDHDYSAWLDTSRTGELTRMMALREWRRSALISHLLVACHHYNVLTGYEQLYDHVAICCVSRMRRYYHSFGFRTLASPIWDPQVQVWGTPMCCSKTTNRRMVRKLSALLEGNAWVRVEWALRIVWSRFWMKWTRT
jgi:hypothetical protein